MDQQMLIDINELETKIMKKSMQARDEMDQMHDNELTQIKSIRKMIPMIKASRPLSKQEIKGKDSMVAFAEKWTGANNINDDDHIIFNNFMHEIDFGDTTDAMKLEYHYLGHWLSINLDKEVIKLSPVEPHKQRSQTEISVYKDDV